MSAMVQQHRLARGERRRKEIDCAIEYTTARPTPQEKRLFATVAAQQQYWSRRWHSSPFVHCSIRNHTTCHPVHRAAVPPWTGSRSASAAGRSTGHPAASG